MVSHNEDRELQIELARLQMKHQTTLSAFLGLLAAEISLFGIVYALYYTTSSEQSKVWFLLVMFGFIFIIFFTIRYFSKQLKEIEEQTKSFRKKYVW